MAVTFEGITKRYGRQSAVDRFDVDVATGSFTVFTGPPQSGKSTLFRLAVGLEQPDDGRILLDGVDVTHRSPADRPIGYVPQSFALYPHLTVAQNIGYPLALAGAPRKTIDAQVKKAAETLSITPLLKKTPDQLSGGEKQRTAIARGLSKDARIFVLDDPLVGLDYKLRERLMDELKALRAELDATFLYGTSDSLEALTMADHLVVIDEGRAVAGGSAETVYDSPPHWRAMELVGFPRANIFHGEARDGVIRAGPFSLPAASLPAASLPAGSRDARAVVVGVRPEAVRLGEGDASATVELVEDLGGERVIYLDADGHELRAAGETQRSHPLEGETTRFAVDPAAVVLFDGETGKPIERPDRAAAA